jgi:hypothetical protein
MATIETPLMPFWGWLAFSEVPAFRALAGGALMMGAVIADVAGDNRAAPEAAQPGVRRVPPMLRGRAEGFRPHLDAVIKCYDISGSVA